MALSDKKVEIVTGRRETDGQVRLSMFTGDLLAITVEERGQRAPTLLLTRAQADRLRSALAELIPLLQEPTTEGNGETTPWRGDERRTTGELR